MKWRILDTGSSSANKNMEIDTRLLEELDVPTLHLYDWNRNSVTYGHFTDPAKHLNLQNCKKWNLELARRPTGGGITFHLSDLAFSVLVPAGHEGFHVNVMDNYAYVNRRVAHAIEEVIGSKTKLLPGETILETEESQFFCMAKPTKYDIMHGSKKVGGGAQRRTKKGFLHQGTIFLMKPSDSLLNDLVSPSICDCINRNSEYLFDENKNLLDIRKLMKEELIKAFLFTPKGKESNYDGNCADRKSF